MANIFNKQQMIMEMVSDLKPEDKEWMIPELVNLDSDEFDKITDRIGYTRIGRFWTFKAIKQTKKKLIL